MKLDFETKPYHMVKILKNGKYVTYHIYRNNKPFLRPVLKDQVISRRQAIGIVNLLNYM
jgi:hypothetical protein